MFCFYFPNGYTLIKSFSNTYRTKCLHLFLSISCMCFCSGCGDGRLAGGLGWELWMLLLLEHSDQRGVLGAATLSSWSGAKPGAVRQQVGGNVTFWTSNIFILRPGKIIVLTWAEVYWFLSQVQTFSCVWCVFFFVALVSMETAQRMQVITQRRVLHLLQPQHQWKRPKWR